MSFPLRLEFLGGLDVIFQNERIHKISISNDYKTMKDLINYITTNMILNKEDIEVFIQDDTIRPGILTLINDTDWELEGELDYELQPGDVIAFTSTLHGG